MGRMSHGSELSDTRFARASRILEHPTTATRSWERRRSFRVQVPARASVWHKGQPQGPYRVCDLSIGGCQLADGPMHHVGEEVDVLLHLPHRAPLWLKAHVERAHRGKLGLCFDKAPARAEDCIQELVVEAIVRKHEREGRRLSLVIEPKIEVRSALIDTLRELGQRAIGVTTALDAVQLLVEEGDLVATAFIEAGAMTLPAGELLEFLMHNHPSVRRVLVGTPADVAEAWIAEATGDVDGLLETPIDPAHVQRLLTRLGCTLRDAYVS